MVSRFNVLSVLGIDCAGWYQLAVRCRDDVWVPGGFRWGLAGGLRSRGPCFAEDPNTDRTGL